jgi:hypothetical protein
MQVYADFVIDHCSGADEEEISGGRDQAMDQVPAVEREISTRREQLPSIAV